MAESLLGEQFVQYYRKHIEAELKERLSGNHYVNQRLQSAMYYGLINGGKRVRALLVYASALAVGKPQSLTDAAAAALEAIHAFSLIHDDLPAMDDDDLRRNQPTCHIAFDEATAILAGDALQSLAFEWLSEPLLNKNARQQIGLLQILARAIGDKGLVAGQAIDLAAVDKQLDLEQLIFMHQLKTGALIAASVEMGARSTGHVSPEKLEALSFYSQSIGLAFQIQDDILDVTADTDVLGKTQGADIAQNKPTFVSSLGLRDAQRYANDQYEKALSAISSFGDCADNLRYLAKYIVKRQY